MGLWCKGGWGLWTAMSRRKVGGGRGGSRRAAWENNIGIFPVPQPQNILLGGGVTFRGREARLKVIARGYGLAGTISGRFHQHSLKEGKRRLQKKCLHVGGSHPKRKRNKKRKTADNQVRDNIRRRVLFIKCQAPQRCY